MKSSRLRYVTGISKKASWPSVPLSAAASHLGYVSHAVGRPLQWDAANERIIGDDEADALLRNVNYREPWELNPLGAAFA